jgi:hypothetical protein
VGKKTWGQIKLFCHRPNGLVQNSHIDSHRTTTPTTRRSPAERALVSKMWEARKESTSRLSTRWSFLVTRLGMSTASANTEMNMAQTQPSKTHDNNKNPGI